MGKNPPANAEAPGDVGLIPGLGRAPGVGNDTRFSLLAGIIPWTEETGDPSPWGHKESDTTERLSMHALLFKKQSKTKFNFIAGALLNF